MDKKSLSRRANRIQNEKIELEYYETRNLTEINERKYGIEIIKKKEESEKFNMLFNKYNNHKTYLLPCIGLADIIEQNDERKIREYLDENLKRYKSKVKNVVF